MLTKVLHLKKIFITLAALIISAGMAFGQEEPIPGPEAVISLAPDTPPAQSFSGGEAGVATKIQIEVSGEVDFEGVTVGKKGLGLDQDFEEVSFWFLWPVGDVKLGSGKLRDGRVEFDLRPYITEPLEAGTYYFEIRFQLSENPTPGATFSLGILDVYMPGCLVEIPIGGAFGSTMTIAAEVPMPTAIFGYVFNLDTGQPVSNALIIAIHAESRERIKALSASDGSYIFEDIKEGAYWLITIQGGYWPDVQKTRVNPGEQMWVQIWLKPMRQVPVPEPIPAPEPE